ETVFPRHPVGIDHVKLQFPIDNSFLNPAGKTIPRLVWWIWTVQQEGSVLNDSFEDIHSLQEAELVTRAEIGSFHEVGRPNRLRTKPQVGDSNRARFLRIVDEVTLGVQVGVFTDDFDRILVGRHSAVRPQTEKDRPDYVILFDRKAVLQWQTRMGDVVNDSYCKMVFRLGF